MAKFRKRPVEIEAVQFVRKGSSSNFAEVVSFVNAGACKAIARAPGQVLIETLEGTMVANIGDWVIRGVHGECYPCKPDIFEKTYEPVEDRNP